VLSGVDVPGGLPLEVLGWGDGAAQCSSETLLRHIDELQALNLLPRYFAAPLFVLWEITARCPLNCDYCYNASPKRVRELTEAELLDVADQLIDMKVFGVCVTGGEPFSRPDFLDVVERLRAGGVAVSTMTSGWHIDRAMAERLVGKLDAISVSLDGPTAEVHDRIRRRAGSFERAVAAIGHLKAVGFDRIGCAFAVTSQNMGDYRRTLELCESIGLTCVRSQVLAVTGKVLLHPEVAGITIEHYARLRQIADEWNAEHPAGPLASWQDPSGHIRAGLRLGRVVGLRITAEGFLCFTPHVPYALGDVSRERIADVWRRGLREAWRHPVVIAELKDVQGPGDIAGLSALSHGDAYGYRQLDPAAVGERA
jgi:MoaA/NifB/PqqE/SkfB family radical SAM enzyme